MTVDETTELPNTNILYEDKEQLKKTHTFHYMAQEEKGVKTHKYVKSHIY